MTAADVSPVAGAGAAVVVGQGAGEDWLEVEAVGAVVVLWVVAAALLQTLVLGMRSASE